MESFAPSQKIDGDLSISGYLQRENPGIYDLQRRILNWKFPVRQTTFTGITFSQEGGFSFITGVQMPQQSVVLW